MLIGCISIGHSHRGRSRNRIEIAARLPKSALA
jgi:hypothetical protein